MSVVCLLQIMELYLNDGDNIWIYDGDKCDDALLAYFDYDTLQNDTHMLWYDFIFSTKTKVLIHRQTSAQGSGFGFHFKVCPGKSCEYDLNCIQ